MAIFCLRLEQKATLGGSSGKPKHNATTLTGRFVVVLRTGKLSHMIKKVLLGVGTLILLAILFIGSSWLLAMTAPAPQIIANVMDLEQIERISKYRSCTGHVTVPQDERESARSMKTYVDVKWEYAFENTVAIYAPFDGYISIIREEPEHGLEGEIWLSPVRTFMPIGVWSFSVQHIIPREDLRIGSYVRAGEVLGYAGVEQTEYGRTFDLVYGKLGIPTTRVDNWTNPFADLSFLFAHMTDDVFSEYQDHGISSRDMLQVTKEERDRDPCRYQGEGPYFENLEHQENWVVLQ